jgi:hypothetical protein
MWRKSKKGRRKGLTVGRDFVWSPSRPRRARGSGDLSEGEGRKKLKKGVDRKERI